MVAVYLANRIIVGALEYTTVVTQRADLKAAIDIYLIANGHAGKIVEVSP